MNKIDRGIAWGGATLRIVALAGAGEDSSKLEALLREKYPEDSRRKIHVPARKWFSKAPDGWEQWCESVRADLPKTYFRVQGRLLDDARLIAEGKAPGFLPDRFHEVSEQEVNSLAADLRAGMLTFCERASLTPPSPKERMLHWNGVNSEDVLQQINKAAAELA